MRSWSINCLGRRCVRRLRLNGGNMANVGLGSYHGKDCTNTSIGKVYSPNEIREIMMNNLRGHYYNDQESDDNVLNGIKQYCYRYLDQETVAKELDIQTIDNALNFLNKYFEELNALQSSLELKYYSWPFTEMAQSIDEFTLSANKQAIVLEVVEGKLCKDVTTALDLVSFCFGIMRLMKKSKEKYTRLEMNKENNQEN